LGAGPGRGDGTMSGDSDVGKVLESVNELVDKYNSLLRVNQLLLEFLRERQLQEEFLEYLKCHDPLPDRQ
jgi:hypothetical protein